MLVHKSCNGSVIVDLNELLKIYGTLSFSLKGLRAGNFSMIPLSRLDSPIPLKLTCPSCKKDIVDFETELLCACPNCSNLKELSKIYKVANVSSLFCDDCLRACFDEVPKVKKTILQLLKDNPKVSIG